MRTELFRRFLVLGAGGSAMSGLAALLVFSVRDQVGWPVGWLFAASVLFAPVYLAGTWVLAPASSVAVVHTWLLVTALVAIAGVASHPLVPRRGTVATAVVGFAAWALCMLLVAGSVV